MRARFGCARHAGPQHGSDRGRSPDASGPPGPGLISRGHRVGQPGRPARRRQRHDGLLQHRVLRRPEAERPVATGVSPGQRAAHRGHGPRAGEDARGAVELLAADRRQHGGGGQRRQGRTRGQAVRRRPEDARVDRGSHRRRDAIDPGDRGSRPVPRGRAAQSEPGGQPGPGRPLSNQRRRRAGRHSDGGGRRGGQPGAAGRTAIRPGPPLPARLSRQPGDDRAYQPVSVADRGSASRSPNCAASR